MDRFVAALNIEHLRKQIAEETDAAKREILSRILDEEEKKLALTLAQPKGKRGLAL